MELFRFDHVNLKINEQYILNHLSFTIDQGCIAGIAPHSAELDFSSGLWLNCNLPEAFVLVLVIVDES